MYKSFKKEVLKALEGAELKSLELIGEQARTGVVDEITAKGVVDTGYMRNSVNYIVDGSKSYVVKSDDGSKTDSVSLSRRKGKKDGVIIGASAEYAPYVNYSKKGKDFLKRGVQRRIDAYEKIVKAIYKEYMK